MPVLAAVSYVAGLLDGLAMPPPGGTTPAMAAYVLPPDPNVETQIPTAYVWPTNGSESRDPRNSGSQPRNTGPGTPSGDKPLVHDTDVFVVWMGSGDDPDTGTIWLGIVDAVMQALRTCYPDPVLVTDPNTGYISQLADIGERMTYKTFVSALADQAYNRFDCLIKVPVTEVISA